VKKISEELLVKTLQQEILELKKLLTRREDEVRAWEMMEKERGIEREDKKKKREEEIRVLKEKKEEKMIVEREIRMEKELEKQKEEKLRVEKEMKMKAEETRMERELEKQKLLEGKKKAKPIKIENKRLEREKVRLEKEKNKEEAERLLVEKKKSYEEEVARREERRKEGMGELWSQMSVLEEWANPYKLHGHYGKYTTEWLKKCLEWSELKSNYNCMKTRFSKEDKELEESNVDVLKRIDEEKMKLFLEEEKNSKEQLRENRRIAKEKIDRERLGIVTRMNSTEKRIEECEEELRVLEKNYKDMTLIKDRFGITSSEWWDRSIKKARELLQEHSSLDMDFLKKQSEDLKVTREELHLKAADLERRKGSREMKQITNNLRVQVVRSVQRGKKKDGKVFNKVGDFMMIQEEPKEYDGDYDEECDMEYEEDGEGDYDCDEEYDEVYEDEDDYDCDADFDDDGDYGNYEDDFGGGDYDEGY
jgi:hypothetical protein